MEHFPSLATIFYKMVARLGKRQSFFFAFLVFFHIDTTYIKLEWNFENFLIFWCTLVARVSWDNMSTSLSWDNMSPGQYVTGTICRRTKCPLSTVENTFFIYCHNHEMCICVCIFVYANLRLCICNFVFAFA